ncbi:MAG: hypothetical protein WC124_09360 [Desulfoplanes sp.]
MERKNNTDKILVQAFVYSGRCGLLFLMLCVLFACSPNRDRLKAKLGYKDLYTTMKHEQDGVNQVREHERTNLETLAKKSAFVVEPELPEFNPLEENRISISVRDEPLHDILFVVARNAGLNIVIDPEINLENRITISFEDTPSSVVVDTLLDAYDLAWTVHDNVLYVRKFEEKTFALEFMNSKSDVSIDSGGDIFGSATAEGGSNDLAGNFQVSTTMGKGIESDSLYGFLEKNIEGLIKGDDGKSGTYALDPTSGHLYVKTSPKRMKAISDLVDTLRKKLSLQVVIDAQILEVTLTDGFNLGVDWNFVQDRVSNGRSYSYGLGFDSTNGVGTRGASGDTSPTALILGQSTSAVNSLDTIFQATINALQTFGGVTVVSNPHIRARHGSPALMTSGTTKSYIKEITRETDSDTSNVSVSTDTATAFQGVMLGVMPFILDNKSVDLNIFPITSEVDLSNEQTFADGTTVTLPVVDVRNVTTSVRAHDGDTIILGGLIYKSGSKTDNSVPGAGEIPGLGWLFNSRVDSESVKELVIIMHIRIV